MRSRDQESLTAWDDDADPSGSPDRNRATRRPASTDDADPNAAGPSPDLDDRLRSLEMRLRTKSSQPAAAAAAPEFTGGTPMGTRIALGVGIALCVGFMAFLVYRLIPGAGSVDNSPDSPAPVAGSADPGSGAGAPASAPSADEPAIAPDDAFQEAKEAIEAFVRADSIDEKLAFVRHPEVVRPHMERYADHDLMTQREVPPWGSRFISRGPFVYAEVFQPRLGFRGVVVEKTDDGWKVDFDSWIGYNERPFDELVTASAAEPVVVRALGRLRTDVDTGVPGDYVVVLRDPDQKMGATAMVSVLDIENEKAFEILRAGRTIPLMVELDGRPAPGETLGTLRVTRIVEAGWFQDPEVGSLLFPLDEEDEGPVLDATAPIEDDPGTTLSFD